MAPLEAMRQVPDRFAVVFGSSVPLFADAVGLDEGTLDETVVLPKETSSADELADQNIASQESTPSNSSVPDIAPGQPAGVPETSDPSAVAIAALPAAADASTSTPVALAPADDVSPVELGVAEPIWSAVASVDGTLGVTLVDRPMSIEAALSAPDAVARLGVPTGRVARPLTKPAVVRKNGIADAPAVDVSAPFAVQLASYRSEELAAQAAEKLTDAHLSALETGSAQVVPGPNGLFRVMSARMERRSDAAALCEQLKSRGQDCLVVQR